MGDQNAAFQLNFLDILRGKAVFKSGRVGIELGV